MLRERARILTKYYLLEMSSEQIAAELRKSRDAVYTALSRSRKAIRANVGERLGRMSFHDEDIRAQSGPDSIASRQ
jgi:DNA-directed RNA polymerase specialized sigma24 family protein